MAQVTFTAYAQPQPQGSMRKVRNRRTGEIILTSDNRNLKPYREEVTRAARQALHAAGLAEPMAAKHVPVAITFVFTLRRPAHCPKGRTEPVVKPDLSKLVRATEDAMTGFIYHDDAQIVQMVAEKHYGAVERVTVHAHTL